MSGPSIAVGATGLDVESERGGPRDQADFDVGVDGVVIVFVFVVVVAAVAVASICALASKVP